MHFYLFFRVFERLICLYSKRLIAVSVLLMSAVTANYNK